MDDLLFLFSTILGYLKCNHPFVDASNNLTAIQGKLQTWF